MPEKKDQHKAGIPDKPRGQQTGFAGNPDQNREEMEKTPHEFPVDARNEPVRVNTDFTDRKTDPS